jgi:hypothetical protein
MPNRTVAEHHGSAFEDPDRHRAPLLPREIQREDLLGMSGQRADDPELALQFVEALNRDVSGNAQLTFPGAREQISCVTSRSAHPEKLCLFEGRIHLR